MKLKLVNLVPLKERDEPTGAFGMAAKELAATYSLERLQQIRDEVMGDMEQEAEPEGGRIADMYADQLHGLDQAITIKRGDSGTPLTYDQAIGRVSKDQFIKSKKFDRGGNRIDEATEKSWSAIDVSRKAEKEIDNKEWNSRTTKKLDMLIALNKAGKFKKDWGEEKLQGWVDQNYSWEKLSRQFKLNESKNNKIKGKLLTERFQELAGIKPLYEADPEAIKGKHYPDEETVKKLRKGPYTKGGQNAHLDVDENMQQGDYSAIEQGWDGLPGDEQRDIINTALSGEARPDDFEKDFDQLKSEIPDFESGVANYLGIDEGRREPHPEADPLNYLEPEDMDNPDEDLVIIGSGYLDIKSNFGERPSQTNGEYAELGQKVVDQLHNGDKEAAIDYIMSQINEGSCGYGPDGVPGDTPGETRGMPADKRTMTMMREVIKKEIKKLSEGEPGDFDKGLEDLMGKGDFKKATSKPVPSFADMKSNEKKSKFKKSGEKSGFDMRGLK